MSSYVQCLCLWCCLWYCLWCCFLSTVHAKSFRPCFEAILNLTQQCNNINHLYATVMGDGSGFASEFNYYLIKSVLTAIFTNRRYSYLITNRPWEYNCAEGKGWGCYFSSPCSDGIVETKDMDFQNRRSPYEPFRLTGPAYIDRGEIEETPYDPNFYIRQLQPLKEVYGTELPSGICDNLQISDILAKDLAGAIAKRMFRLNEKTKKAVANINRRYEYIQTNRTYASLLLRLSDKRYEMPEEDWALASDPVYVTNRFLEALHNHTEYHKLKHHIKDIFLGK